MGFPRGDCGRDRSGGSSAGKDIIMHRLIPGIREFRENVFPSRRARFEELASGQQPSTLFITCSDSRVVPEMITQTEPGELFVLRKAGNLVPPDEAARSGEAATIEYAVQVLKVEDVIVCGHSHCGAIAGLLRPTLIEGLPAVEKWLEHAEQACREIADQNLMTNDNDDLLTSAIKANVVVQLNHLRTYAAVSQAEQRGELRLHGCFYRFETGEVTVFDDPRRKFVPIAEYVASEVAGAR
jgi:carbonic anhydrase